MMAGIPSDLELLSGESLRRADYVGFRQVTGPAEDWQNTWRGPVHTRTARMTVTSRRLHFFPVGTLGDALPFSSRWPAQWWLLGVRPEALFVSPSAFELTEIDRLPPWSSTFSTPPRFWIGDASWEFALLSRRGFFPLYRQAPASAAAEHFRAVEDAWIKALEAAG